MISKPLKAVWKSLNNNRLFSAINTIGLSVGLAACLLILLYVQNETSYDKHWADAERLYRVHTTFDLPGRDAYRLPTTSSLLAPAMENYFSGEIETGSRAWSIDITYRVNDEVYSDVAVAVDPAFVDLFPLDLIQGSLETTLADTASMALSEATAVVLFGTADALGETVTVEYQAEKRDYRITAVYREPQNNTVLELPALIRFDETWNVPVLNTWNQVPVASYLKLAPGVSATAMSNRLNDFSDANVDVSAMSPGPETTSSDRLRFDMENVRDLYLDSNFENFTTGGNRTTVQAFSLIAVLILVVAGMNFAVLSAARSTRRAPDVAIRKTLGATRSQLMGQYLGESFLLVGLSLILGLMLVELLRPVFEGLLGTQLFVDYQSPGFYLSLLVLFVLTGLLGGLYPALILSGFNPATVFSAGTGRGKHDAKSLRNALVIFQFSISIALIIASSVIYLQVRYVSSRDPGFNQDNVIVINDLFNREDVAANREALRQRVQTLPDVVNATLSGYHPMATTPFSRMSASYRVEGRPDESFILANTFIDEYYFDTYEIELIAGRNFSPARDVAAGADTDAPRPLIINEAAMRYLGFPDTEAALAGNLYYPNGNAFYAIIGVAADTQFYSLRAEPRPEISVLSPNFSDTLSVRFQGSPQAMMEELENTWHAVMGDAVFNADFLDPYIEREFAQESREGLMFIAFSLFAIFITCLGLYASSSFVVERRTKEIGIRKVMGAEVREIVTLLMWQFSKPVLIANVIAWPAALWAMLTWLQRFPYQIDTLLLIPLCVLAGFIALSIAWLTVAGNTVKVATTNPVYALRYE